MDTKEILISQYNAGLSMLKNVITSADEEIWFKNTGKSSPFWHIIYHLLFCTDCYLSKDVKTFIPWDKHRKNLQFLGEIPIPPHGKPDISNPYTKSEILEYFDKIQSSLKERIKDTDLDSESGFYWVPVNKLELQLYNIRHIQHHTGQLAYILRDQKDTGINWVVKGENI